MKNKKRYVISYSHGISRNKMYHVIHQSIIEKESQKELRKVVHKFLKRTGIVLN